MMETRRKEKGECSFNGLYLRYKHGAIDRDLEFNLSKNEFKVLTTMNCYYCNDAPSNIHKGRTAYGEYIYNGIDRKNSDVGYSLDNSVPCCSICNRAKASLKFEDFLIWINRIKSNNKGNS